MRAQAAARASAPSGNVDTNSDECNPRFTPDQDATGTRWPRPSLAPSVIPNAASDTTATGHTSDQAEDRLRVRPDTNPEIDEQDGGTDSDKESSTRANSTRQAKSTGTRPHTVTRLSPVPEPEEPLGPLSELSDIEKSEETTRKEKRRKATIKAGKRKATIVGSDEEVIRDSSRPRRKAVKKGKK